MPFTSSMPKWMYDVQRGTVSSSPSLSILDTAVLAEEIARYSLYWASEFSPLYTIGYDVSVKFMS